MTRASRAGVAVLLLTLLPGCSSSAAPVAGPSSTPSPVVSKPAPRPAPAPTWPLTGLPAQGSRSAPALTIKVDNIGQARPQSGLDRADLVFESLVEGGLTRLDAVFHSQSADLVGPIRSARPVDGALLRGLGGGLFAYSGAAKGEIAPAKADSTAVLISHDENPGPFTKLRSRRAPQNVFASTDALRRAGSLSARKPSAPPPLFRYGAALAEAVPAAQAQVWLSGMSSARWTYGEGGWRRFQNGTPDTLTSGAQVRTVNVVILRVDVTGSGIRDAAGNEDPYVRLVGTGTAQVLREGRLITGTWSRPSLTSATTLRATSGRIITLAPGQSWIELVPKDRGRVSVS